ncbi:hypothetical protein H0G86_012985 [Trichoderma simmonsii]|uniref:G domain-containing protein n=1 Tax=Trichoderma simmonsii TaxID=1491479 RepID=A0A8G0LPK1_9HYPO|nr:hypothetical protein H0G86_012985 [Trichoderma simmonsii]
MSSFHKESIADLAEKCLSKFKAAVEGGTLVDHEALRSRLADFSLWDDTVGARAKTGLSLDSRFRNRLDDLTLIKTVLGLLIDCLGDYIELKSKGSSTIEALGNIEQLIRNLALIGVAIRQTGKASRNRRADETFHPEEHQQFREHLECIILLRPNENQPEVDGLNSVEINKLIESTQNKPDQHRHVAEKAEYLFSSRLSELDSSRLSSMQKRLIEANLRRRHRFLQAHKRYMHAKKKELPVNVSSFDEEAVLELQPFDLVATPAARGSVTTSSEDPEIGLGIAVPETTNISLASTAEGALRYIPPSTIARSQITLLAADTEFPKPPSLSSDLLVSMCPCCCQSLPSKYFQSSTKWMQHIIEDVYPYTCVAENCPTPYLLFATTKAWETHVENDHPPSWKCPFCDEDDVIFPVKQHLENHLEILHQDALGAHSFADILSWSSIQYMGISSCPLCSSYGPRDTPDIVDHVVRHAYEFALRALPWPRLETQKDIEKQIGTYSLPEDQYIAGRLGDWIAKLSSTSKPKLQISQYDKNEHGLLDIESVNRDDNFFAHHEYFEVEDLDSITMQTASSCEMSSRTSQIESHIKHDTYDNDTNWQSLLTTAIKDDNEDIVDRLLESGVDIDVNSKDFEGRSPLSIAISLQHKSIIDILIAHGCKVDDTASSLGTEKGTSAIIPKNPINYNTMIFSRASSPAISLESDNANLELPKLTPDDTVIAVMGITGAGKSTFISYFAPDAKIGHELQSCTSEIGIYAATIGDKRCYLIDTPGFDDTNRSDTEVLRQVADWLNRLYKAQIRLTGIVYLHRITDNRMGGTALKNLSIFKKLCGDEGLSCVVLATTMWGFVSREEGERRERDLSTKPEYWAGMVNRGSKVLRLDKGAISALAVMEHIFAQRRRITLDIQQEMASGKTLDETSAGQEVQADLAALRKKHKRDLAILRKEMEQEFNKRDARAREDFNQVRADLEKKIQLAAQDGERLRVDMKQLQTQRNEELQRLRDEAHKKEMEARKQLMDTRIQLDLARQRNDFEAQMMHMKEQWAKREAEIARQEREDVDKKRKKEDVCVIM